MGKNIMVKNEKKEQTKTTKSLPNITLIWVKSKK